MPRGTWVADSTLMFQTGKLRPREGGKGSPQVTWLATGSQPQSQAPCLLRKPCDNQVETGVEAVPPSAGGTLLFALVHRDSENTGKTGPSLYTTRKFAVVLRNSQVFPRFPSYPVFNVNLKVLPPDTKAAGTTPRKGESTATLRRMWSRSRATTLDKSLAGSWKDAHAPGQKCPSKGGTWRDSSTYVYAHMCTWMFTAAIFAMTKCVQPNHPLLRAKMDKLRSIHNESLQNEV